MTWAGFSGTDAQLQKWLKELKAWASDVARRRRRPEMADDIESAALDILVEASAVGSALTRDLDLKVAKALDLRDSLTTARDSDLGAGLDDFEGSFLEEFIADSATEHQEDVMIALLDGTPVIEEGRDLDEIVQDIADHRKELVPIEDQALSLKHLFGYTAKEIGQYLGYSTSYVYQILRRARGRLKGVRDLREINSRIHADPEFTKLEVAWLTI